MLDRLQKLIREAGGESPGRMEVIQTSLADAIKYIGKLGLDIDRDFTDFERNFKVAQSLCKLGSTQRKDMPVISGDDVKRFQKALEVGILDINVPHAPETDVKNPFPTGLTGGLAQKWLEAGLRDGSEKDDVVDVEMGSIPIKKLKPIQKQVYFDKAVQAIEFLGVEQSMALIQKSYFITSKDGFIIDGHHRWLSGLLLNSDMVVDCLIIDLPLRKLLPASLAFSDAIGNKRNA